MSALGLGCVKTFGCVKTSTLAAGVEASRRNCIPESQILLHTRDVMPSWGIVFSTFRGCMSFYTARVISRPHVVTRPCPLYHRKRTFDCPLCAISKRAHHFRLGLLHPSKRTEHALTGYPGEVGVCRFLCIIDMETPGDINLPPANSITHISVVSRNALDAFGQ